MKLDATKLDKIDRNSFQVWLITRPRSVQELANLYPPWFVYRVKPGAPYSLTGPGSEGWIYGYREDGLVCFDAVHLEVHPDHRRENGEFATARGDVYPVPDGIRANIDPRWLEPIHEVT